MSVIDFLRQPTDKRLRKEIQNICDSYNHPWDLLAELSQNAMDAIRLHKSQYGDQAKAHEILISLDATTRSLRVRDSGIGFLPGKIEEFLAPHGSGKDPTSLKTIGQKGVGLTYAIFMADRFTIETVSTLGKIRGIVAGASQWKSAKSDDLPNLTLEVRESGENDPSITYTDITIDFIDQNYTDPSEDLFIQTPAVIEYILRTKTAIGSTTSVFSDNGEMEKIKVTLDVTLSSGERKIITIDPSFLLPELLSGPDSFIDLADLLKQAAKLNDKQKVKLLQGKCLRIKGATTRSGRNIKYYGFYVPTRATWQEISAKNGLMHTSEPAETEPTGMYQGGIFVATRGMPTGIELPHPQTGSAGYWPNCFILIEDSSLTFDLGRKSVPTRTQGLLKEIAREIFSEFRSWWGYLSVDPEISGKLATIANYEKYQEFESLKALPDLGLKQILYAKHPDGQEAAVAAIFHELVAAKLLPGYITLKTGYKQSYDWWGLYEISSVGETYRKKGLKEGDLFPTIIEFKYVAESVLSDFEDNKLFSDIDLIVCWDLNETKFSTNNVTVRSIPIKDRFYAGSTHELEWAGSYGLGDSGIKRVITLRTLIDQLASGLLKQ